MKTFSFKKGFTLIELLAVIVILAIILLIATPTILNVVGEARRGAFEASAQGISKAAENDCLAKMVSGREATSQVVFADGQIVSEDLIPFTGKNPKEGVVLVNRDCQVQMAIDDGTWCIQKGYSDNEIIVTALAEMTEDCAISSFTGEIVWELAGDGTITAILPIVTGTNVFYSINGTDWQVSNVFEGLDPNTSYTFYVQIDGVTSPDVINTSTPAVYQITYQATTGGSINPAERDVIANGTAAAPTVLVDEGYQFATFIITEGAGNGDLNLVTGEITNVTGNMTLEATFMINSYTVNYQSNQGATFNPNYRTVTHGGDSTTPDITIEEGYTFSHYTAVSGVGNGNLNTTTGNVTNVIGNMTIEASFELTEYTVTYEITTGGTITPPNRIVQHGNNAIAPDVTLNAGYELIDFEITSGGGSATLNPSTGALTNVVGHVTVRANLALETFTVTYDADGGSCDPTSRIVDWGTSAAGPSCSQTGYTVANYSITSGSCHGTFDSGTGACSEVRSNITVRANWVINTYTVTYDANGGSCDPTHRTVNWGASAAGPSCSRTGHSLSNYSITSGSCHGTFDSGTGACSEVRANITVRANWAVSNPCGGITQVSWQGYNYSVVGIGTQCWLAENLRATHNGCLSNTWNESAPLNACATHGPNEGGSQGSYMDGLSSGMVLYQWGAAMNGSTTEGAQGLCPTGWHIPTDAEWTILTNFVGANPGTQLKSASPSWNGTNTVGFSALPAGYRVTSGSLGFVGALGSWWSSSPSGTNAWFRSLLSGSSGVGRNTSSQAFGYSVRCVLGL